MRKKKLWKDIGRSFTGSWGRFFSILSLMALGTFAFVGLKVTGPDMRATAENFYDQTNLADMTLTSTWGLDESDQDLLEKNKQLDDVEYGYLEDVTLKDTDTSMRIFSAPEEISQYEVVEGNMPQKNNEIALDYQQQDHFDLGDTIKLEQEKSDDSENETDESSPEILKRTTYKVVGFVKSSEITETSNIGQTTVGTGQLDSYGVVSEENFDSDVYMIARMNFSDTRGLNAYSDKYDRLIRKHQKSVEKLFDDQSEKRLADVKEDRQQEIDDGWKKIKDTKQKLKDVKTQLDKAQEQIQEGQEQIDENQAQLENEVAQAQVQINDGQQQLDQGKSTIATAENQLVQAKTQLDNGKASLSQKWTQLQSAKSQLDNAQSSLASNKEQLDKGAAAIKQGKEQFASSQQKISENEQNLQAGQSQVEQQQKNLQQQQGEKQGQIEQLQNKSEEAKKQAAPLKANYEQIAAENKPVITQLEEQKEQVESEEDSQRLDEQIQAKQEEIDAAEQSYNQALGTSDALQQKADNAQSTLDATLGEKQEQLSNVKSEAEQGQQTLDSAKQQLEQKQTQLVQKEQEYQSGLEQYNAGVQTFNQNKAAYEQGLSKWVSGMEALNKNSAEYQKNAQNLATAKQELGNKEAELIQAKNTLADKQVQGQNQLDQAQDKLSDKKAEYEENKADYEKQKEKADKEIPDREQELKDAQEELDDLQAPEYTFDDRKDGNPGYKQYLENSQRVDILSNIFPVFLFAIAVLVSLTTMTRFVDEERINTGTLKALGYSNWDVKKKFVVYGIVSSSLGAILGTALGHTLLPTVIFEAYAASSTFDQVTLNFSTFYSFIGFAIAIICTTLPAYLVASRELNEKTARLLEAKPPKKGSRILLERITPIWNHLSFTYKVTARNLFRYKKRMFMTVFGVAGCTALLVTGFGIRDSLTGIVDHQFDDLVKYDLIVNKKDNLSDDEQEQMDKKLDQNDVANATDVYYEQLNVRAGENNDTQDITLLVPDDEQAFNQDVEMVTREEQKQLSLSDDGAILSEKLADLLDAKTGDTVTLEDEDGQSHQVKISGITEMYMGHYIYMSQKAYQDAFDSNSDPNSYLVTLNDTSQENIDKQSSAFMDLDGVQGVVQSSAISEQVDNVIDGLNNVILVLITCATLLALVVIYNLTNINVSERIRELSTIKVLGFYNREVTMYIYRETILLSILGILAGYVVGYFLHGFIMQTLPPDEAMFSPGLQLSNFGLSAGITLLITILLMFVIHRKLKNIDMLEALQSAD
ncbi:MAG: FtsX-like permease family protein [Tetragenococcus halophilus]|uniref:FtsX-like permease family protein n=1 Tax=Tetragenococcus halophilus TaxID=51669 RepID=UPI000CC0DE31|nr:FtsX-like permease family protein [Tetragenococcus halophilus]MCF1675222.1 FtsX-like permease family protein [Tetragenococcus halophilus]MCO7027375.1 FtsX-like permease family protein [Tetragenococcus halophilus]MDN6112391.1 FtsX-like permease family protein [Tetragenococcus halophilus]MDN6129135.1 FtsX-like permease family protein [Tetragenococcus halophilus]MDN6141627.1 FtsX-like permease family protein [Tetragenococcus halophilus]